MGVCVCVCVVVSYNNAYRLMILEAFSHGKFFQAALEVIQVAFLYSFAVVAKFQLALCARAVAELLVSCHRAVDSLL